MTIKPLVCMDYTAVSPYTALVEAEKQLLKAKFLVVLDGEKFLGLVTLADTVRRPHKLVVDCITEKPQVTTGDSIEQVISVMESNSLLAVPVYEDKTFYGVATYPAILSHIQSRKDELERHIHKAERFDSLCFVVAGIGHDLNNILGGSIGNIDLALDSTEDVSGMLKYIKNAQAILEHANTLIRQLLSLSHEQKESRQEVFLPALISEVVPLYLKGKGVRAEFQLEDNLPPVKIDRTQFIQVISNLVINAVQSMPGPGSICIGCDGIRLPAGEGAEDRESVKYVRMSVADPGEGISSQHLERIFDPYFTTKESGTGLGLAVVCSIVKNHDGYVEVESERGKGTRFDVFIPVCEKRE